MRIDFNRPYLTGKELQYMQEAVNSYKLSGNGSFTKRCQEFFEKPMGSKIPVCDHYPERRADEFLLNRFMNRLESEHPGVTCTIHLGEHITIERTSPTYHEKVKEEYAKRQKDKNKKKET